jgi:hypothetical protein
MKQMGMTPTRTDGTTTIGTAAGDVANVNGSLDGDQGGAGIYSAILNNRMVVFSTFGSAADVKRLTAQLDALRASIAIAAPVAPAVVTPSPATPKP